MIKDQYPRLQDALNKQQVEQYFNQFFQDQNNTTCFECSNKSKQWADKSHGIFLCLNCAAQYKQLGSIVSIKSVNLDLWSKQQLQLMKLGGNKRFKQFLQHYQLSHLNYKHKLRTKAAQYYRILLNQQLHGRLPPQAPIKQIAQQFTRDQIPLSDMSPEQLLDYSKEKALELGSITKQTAIKIGTKTKQISTKAYNKIQHKITSGQLKEDAKKAAQQVKSKAKAIWSFAMSKIKDQKQQNNRKQPQL